jgi:AraC-like DNA-binding protein
MTNRFRVSSALLKRLDDMGLSVTAVLQQAGLPAALFRQEKILVSTEELFAFYRGIAEVGGAPDTGLKLGSEDRLERYDPIALAALSSRSLGDALQRLGRYKQLTCPEKITVVPRGNECELRFAWLLAHEPEPALLVDVCFAWIISIARRGTGQRVEPKQVEFQREAGNRALYEKHFGCPVKFQARHNGLIFHAADVDKPFVTHNAELLGMVAPQLEAELTEQISEKTIREQVKGVLKRLLAGQRPGLHDVARELRLSARTLQRRLTGEKVTFQRLMEEARRELARHYLMHSSLELNETAYLLGYEDANSFFRAFHQWEGTSPGDWRATHRVSAPHAIPLQSASATSVSAANR